MTKHKKIGLVVILFGCFIQLFFINKRIHNFPFMIYDMYSRPEQLKAYSQHFLILADQDSINLVKLPIMQEGLLINSLRKYQEYVEKGRSTWEGALDKRQAQLGSTFKKRSDAHLRYSEADIIAYPNWLKEYLEHHVVNRPVKRLQVYATTIESKQAWISKEVKLIDIE